MYDLNRFIIAQEKTYDNALEEVKRGLKVTHWMWYIFPQITGLGNSSTSEYYSIKNIEEAKEYINNELLRNRLLEITQCILESNKRPIEILGYIDSIKLRSCMTLFNEISDIKIFKRVLEKFYNGEKNQKTIRILNGMKEGKNNGIHRI